MRPPPAKASFSDAGSSKSALRVSMPFAVSAVSFSGLRLAATMRDGATAKVSTR